MASPVVPLVTIDELQARIVESGRLPDIFEYIEMTAKVVDAKLDLSFAKDLYGMVRRKECCIPHEYLVKYGVLAEKNSSANVKIMFEQYGFIEGIDFRLLLNVQEQKGRGGHNKKIYMLHPRVFKICLMRAKNTQKYAVYYTLLEEFIVYYKDCQDALKDRYIITMTSRHIEDVKEKDGKIDQLTALLASFRAENRQAIGGLVTKVDEVVQQNNGLKSDLTEVKQQNTDLGVKIDKVVDLAREGFVHVGKVADRIVAGAEDTALPPEDDKKTECLSIVRLGNPAAEYIAIRTQIKSLPTRLKKLRQKYPNLREVAQYSPSPNASSLWNRVREDLGGRLIMLGTNGIKFRLANGLTEAAFADSVQVVYNKPKSRAERVCKAEKAWSAVRMTTTTTVVKTIARVRPPTPATYNLTDADIDALFDEEEPGDEGQ